MLIFSFIFSLCNIFFLSNGTLTSVGEQLPLMEGPIKTASRSFRISECTFSVWTQVLHEYLTHTQQVRDSYEFHLKSKDLNVSLIASIIQK